MYVKRNIQARSCKHSLSGKTETIKYSESVFVAFGIQHAIRMRHIVICGLSGSTISFHIVPLKVICGLSGSTISFHIWS